MVDLQSIKQIVKDLQDEYKLPVESCLFIATQIQRNQILQNGLMVSKSDSHPVALEAIAIGIGYNPDSTQNVAGAIAELSRTIEESKV